MLTPELTQPVFRTYVLRIDSDCSRLFVGSRVLELEGHAVFVGLPAGNVVPIELDDLVLESTVFFTGLQLEIAFSH